MDKTKAINDILVKNSLPDSQKLDKSEIKEMVDEVSKEQKLILERKYVSKEELKKSVVN